MAAVGASCLWKGRTLMSKVGAATGPEKAYSQRFSARPQKSAPRNPSRSGRAGIF